MRSVLIKMMKLESVRQATSNYSTEGMQGRREDVKWSSDNTGKDDSVACVLAVHHEDLSSVAWTHTVGENFVL